MNAEERCAQLVKAAEEAVKAFKFEAPAKEKKEFEFPTDSFGLDNPMEMPNFG